MKRARLSAILCFTFVALAATLSGCGDDNTTIIQGGGGLLLTGNFPGSEVSEHFVSDDGRAFTHSDAKVNKGMQVFWNASNGHAVVLYLDSYERLWAHYFDGTTFTPGVEIRGPGQRELSEDNYPIGERRSDDEFVIFEQFRVLFLNTAALSNANASGRNNDAILLFCREDEEPSTGDSTGNGLDPDADENDRLYGTYFDFSERTNVTSVGDPTVHYGFETVATVLDFDNKLPGETADDDVTTFGFVSDSLKWTHAYDTRGTKNTEDPLAYEGSGGDLAYAPATRSGDPTSFVFFVWRKGQQSGTSSVQARWHYLEFTLSQAGNALPTQTTNGQNTFPLPASVTISDGESVDDPAVVHNGAFLWRAPTTVARGVFMTSFAAGTAPTTIELSKAVEDTAGSVPGSPWIGTDPDLPWMENVYGGDHGLSSLYAIFETSGGTERVAVAKVDLGVAPAREIANIEAPGGGSINYLDGSRIARNGDWILALWQQAPGTSTLTTGSRQIFANVVQTRIGAGARTLANSLATTAPAPNQASDPDEPQNLIWQSEVADGTSDPICGVQSNRNRINFAWTEVPAQVATLVHNGVTATLGTTGTTPPTFVYAVTGATDGRVGNTHVSYQAYDHENGMNAVVTDLGTADGAPLLYFLQNANNPTDSGATGAFDEMRVHGNAGIPGATPADARVISTDAPGQERAMNDAFNEDTRIDDYTEVAGRFLRIQTAPLSTVAGNHGGTVVHLFMREPRGGASALKADLVTRRFVKASFSAASAAATFVTAHAPALTADPTSLFGLANHDAFIEPVAYVDDDEIGPKTAFTTVSGSTVGVYFRSDWHWHYQQFNGTTWLVNGGVGAPEPIDNMTANSLFFGRDQQAYAFARRLNGQCDNGNGVLCFFSTWLDGDDIGLRRWYVRVHD